jgi:hypothetical protein
MVGAAVDAARHSMHDTEIVRVAATVADLASRRASSLMTTRCWLLNIAGRRDELLSGRDAISALLIQHYHG